MKKLGFGCMRLPVFDGNDENIDIEQFKQMVDEFLANGFTYFDTAYVYHKRKGEHAVKEALVDRHPRDSFTVATKLFLTGLTGEEHMEQMFNEQLDNLGVEYFDYYLLHNCNVANLKKAEEYKAFDFVLKKKAEGKIRHVGFSFHDTADVLEDTLKKHPEMEFVQLQINYLDWDNSAVQSGKCYEVAAKYGKDVFVMEPVKGGTLAKLPEDCNELFKNFNADASPASYAVRFAASLPAVKIVLSGMSNLDQLRDNMSYMKEMKELTEEEYSVINEVKKKTLSKIYIQCTGCRYCVEDGCPMNIAIPEYFAAYNEHKAKGGFGGKAYFKTISGRFGKPSECIQCGQCEEHCPQHLEIRQYLEEIASEFEAEKK